MTVGDICSRDVVVALKSDGIVEAARRMRTRHVGDIVVVDNGPPGPVPIGIVTDRDIVISVVAGDPDHMDYLLVGDVMTGDVVTVAEANSVEEALARMEANGVRRLPVVDPGGVLVGVVTLDDVLQHVTPAPGHVAQIVFSAQQRERRPRH
jgi:CBS domain-containing protein